MTLMHTRLQAPLINTPLQRGETARVGRWNRFSGFRCCAEPAEAVQGLPSRPVTPLKRGVNERSARKPSNLFNPLLCLLVAVRR